jgi:cell division protein FtsN
MATLKLAASRESPGTPPDLAASLGGGDTSALYKAAIGAKGQDYYLRQFARFDAAGRTGPNWHWAAYWSTLNWLMYRRMWKHAMVYAAAMVGGALLIFGLGKLAFGYSSTNGLLLFLGFLTASYIVPGLYANGWFYNFCQDRISKALRDTDTLQAACDALTQEAASKQRLWTLASANVAVLAAIAGSTTFFMTTPTDSMSEAPPAQTSALLNTSAQAQGKVQDVAQDTMQGASEGKGQDAEPPAAALPSGAPNATAAPAAHTPPTAPPATADVVLAQASPSPARPSPVTTPPAVAAPKPEATKPPEAPAKPDVKPEAKSLTKSEGTPSAAAAPASPTAAKAKAAAKAEPAKTKVWFVQAGAFAQESNAQNVRLKLEGAGLQTLAESSDTKAGKLIRVRVGPFTTKAEAENASLQIKALDLPAVLFRE